MSTEHIVSAGQKYGVQHPVQCFAVAGLLLGVSFLHAALWWLGLFGIALFYFISKSMHVTLRQAVIGGGVAGTVQFLIVSSWLWSAYPIQWLEINNSVAVLFIGVVWLVCSITFGLAKVLPALYGHFFLGDTQSLSVSAVFFAPVWLTSEMCGSLLFSLVHAGSGGAVSLHAAMGYVGYLFAEHGALVQLAQVGGVYILSLLYVGAALLLYVCILKKQFVYTGLLLMCMLGGSLVPYINPYQNDDYAVLTLSTDYHASGQSAQDVEEAQYQDLINRVIQGLRGDAAYIVLPENARFARSFESPEAVLDFMRTYSEADVVLIDSGTEDADNGFTHVVSTLYDTQANSYSKQYKEYLVPTGEYIPALYTYVLHRTGFGDELARFLESYNSIPKENDEVYLPRAPGVLFCFASVSPYRLRTVAANTAVPFVVHVVSHGWFTDPWLLQHMLDQQMRVNTLFAHTTVYQAAHNYTSIRY